MSDELKLFLKDVAEQNLGRLSVRAKTLLESSSPAADESAKHALKDSVRVPLLMTRAMREVVESEEWQWEDVLAAAESVTEAEYNAIARAVWPEEATPVATESVAPVFMQQGETLNEYLVRRDESAKPVAYVEPNDLEQLAKYLKQCSCVLHREPGRKRVALYTHPASTASTASKEAKPSNNVALADLLIREICETDPADPNAEDTVCIGVTATSAKTPFSLSRRMERSRCHSGRFPTFSTAPKVMLGKCSMRM